MNVMHPMLGSCKILIQFEGNVNQLVLIRSMMTEHFEKNYCISTKPRYWLLWGAAERNIEDLGKTCLLSVNGNILSQTKAYQIFLKASKSIDRITINKIK
jgi:hypothetical protein